LLLILLDVARALSPATARR